MRQRVEAGMLQQSDEARQFPERKGFRRGKAVHDLGECQGCRDARPRQQLAWPVRRCDARVLQQPGTLDQLRALRIRSAVERVIQAVGEDRDIVQYLSVSRYAVRMDHLMTGSVDFAQPQPGAHGHADQAAFALEVPVAQLVVSPAQRRADGVDHRHQDCTRSRGDKQQGCQYLPDRDSGRPGHDKFAGVRQTGKRQHGSEQEHERPELLDRGGQLHQGKLHDGEYRDFRSVTCLAQVLDDLDREHDHDQQAKHDARADQELPTDVNSQRLKHSQSPPAARGEGKSGGGGAGTAAPPPAPGRIM